MTNNWRDTLTNYSPAYDANDWATLNSRLQATNTLPIWKKGVLFALFAILLFSSGFVVRGLFIKESHTSVPSAAVGNSQSNSRTSLGMMANSAQENAPKQKPSKAQSAALLGTDDTNLSSELPIENASGKTILTTPDPVSDQAKRYPNTFAGLRAESQIGEGMHTTTFAQKLATSALASQDFKEHTEYSIKTDDTHQSSTNTASTNFEHASRTTEPIQKIAEGAIDAYQATSDAVTPVPKDSASAPETSSKNAAHLAEEDTDVLKSIQTPEMTEIGLTFSPFYQTSWVKKRMPGASISSEPPKALNQVHELGVDMQLGKNLYAGVGYGYHFWGKEYAGISNYRAHAPFLRVGFSLPVLPNFNVIAQAGASVLMESFEFDKQRWIDGSFVTVTEKGTATGNIANYGLGVSYSFKEMHSLYSLIETSGRSLTIGYKYHLFGN